MSDGRACPAVSYASEPPVRGWTHVVDAGDWLPGLIAERTTLLVDEQLARSVAAGFAVPDHARAVGQVERDLYVYWRNAGVVVVDGVVAAHGRPAELAAVAGIVERILGDLPNIVAGTLHRLCAAAVTGGVTAVW